MTVSRHMEQPEHDHRLGEAPLSQRLRVETKDLHTAAERSGIMKRVVRGEITRREYVSLLENLAEIYRALEDELSRHRSHPSLSWLDLEALARSDSIAHDLRRLRRTDDDAPSIRPVARTYVARIHEAAAQDPTLLVAHAYVRYLGDLSGGQILAPIIARALGADADDALTFYRFERIDDADEFKRGFRDHLDASSNADVSDRIIEEAKNAFGLHEELFKELESN